MDIPAYLARLGYDGSLTATAETLRVLQRAHLYSVPFENLDIALGHPIQLNEATLFSKVVNQKRGGFCYELNGLFARLLSALGYQVTLLSASSANDDGSYAPDFDHLVLLVTTPDDPNTPWLVDVGWGDGFVDPLRLQESGEQQQGGRVFQLSAEGDWLVVTEKTAEGKWLKHYRFNLTPYAFEDFFAMCRYHQTSPDSLFTQKRLCTIYTPEGRATLSNDRLIITKDTGGLRGSGIREERELLDENEVRQVLKDIFQVHL